MITKYYGYEGQERLYSEPEEVIEYLLEGEEDYQNFPIEVYVFKPMIPFSDNREYAKNFIEDLLENLDDVYGDPEGDPTEATENIIIAATKLAKVIAEEYKSWMCEPTGEILKYSKPEAYNMIGRSL